MNLQVNPKRQRRARRMQGHGRARAGKRQHQCFGNPKRRKVGVRGNDFNIRALILRIGFWPIVL